LPFDWAQGGEPVEPFDIWDLLFVIFNNRIIYRFFISVYYL
jgi:hypothetical protein